MTRPVVTLTLNPAIDAVCIADEVVPMRKVRTRNERCDPGGGGLNVARVIRELGGEAKAFYLAGQPHWSATAHTCGGRRPFHASGRQFVYGTRSHAPSPEVFEPVLAGCFRKGDANH